MDIVDRCRAKLDHFRIKELKDILSRVGLSKQGRKQDLMDRVLALLYDEGTPGLYKHIDGKEDLVAIIEDAYRKMQDEGVTDSNAKKQSRKMQDEGVADSNAEKQSSLGSNKKQLQEESEPVNVRCVCGRSGVVDLTIQCADPSCNVWQHTGCALSAEHDIKKLPFADFFCQACRIERSDPFWEPIDHLLYPEKLLVSRTQDVGSKPSLQIEKTFDLSKVTKDLMVREEYDIQAWCMLLPDSVPFRVQWPQYAELLVNGVPFKTYNRPGSNSLGANGRDDAVKITLFLVHGVNKISLSGCDDRDFCLGVRLVKRRTLQQVLSMIPQESVGEPFEDALARVKRCSGGGGVIAENEESDSDLEVVTDSITVSLRCPMTGCRMKTAGRFKSCVHMGCFDLEAFIQLNERSRKWQCPICLKNYSLDSIAIDPYFNRILNMMRDCREDISEIELKSDGSWRVKNEVAIKGLSLWHFPDGSLINSSGSSNPFMKENLSSKHESKAAAGVGQSEDMPQQNLLETYTKFDQEVITMSSSSSDDHKDIALPSNQKYGGHQIGNVGYKEDEVNSSPLKNGMPPVNMDNSSSAQVINAVDVIILSDSEEEEQEVEVEVEEVEVVEEEEVEVEEEAIFQPDSSATMVGYDKSGISPTALSENDPSVLSSSWMSDSSHKTKHDAIMMPQFPLAPTSEDCSGFHPINSAADKLEVVTGFDQTPATTSSIVTVCKVATLSGDDSCREGSCRDEHCSGVEAHIQSTDPDHIESLVYVRSKRRLSLLSNTNGESSLDQDVGRKRTGDPFDFPKRQRSTRRRQN